MPGLAPVCFQVTTSCGDPIQRSTLHPAVCTAQQSPGHSHSKAHAARVANTVSWPHFFGLDPNFLQSLQPQQPAKCKKIINDAYFCAKPPDYSSQPKSELQRPAARAFAEQVGLVGEFSKQSTFYLKEAAQLIDRAHHRLDGLQYTLDKADKATGGSWQRLPGIQKLVASAAKETDEAHLEALRTRKLARRAFKNALSGALKEAEEQGKNLITEPLMASLEAVRGPRAIVTPWSSHAAHPPGLYCQKVCENRPEQDEHFL